MKPERNYLAQRERELRREREERRGTAVAKVVQNDGLCSTGGGGRVAVARPQPSLLPASHFK